MSVRDSIKGPLRSREEMARDVSIVLASSLSYRAKFAVLNNVCWEWTEGDDKYEGCNLWTKDARDTYVKRFDKTKRVRVRGLRHEHAVPRCVVIGLLQQLSNPSPDCVNELLSRLLFGVVVTTQQDKKLNRKYRQGMPPAFFAPGESFQHPWLRYLDFVDDPGFDRVPMGKPTCHQIVKLLRLQRRYDQLVRE